MNARSVSRHRDIPLNHIRNIGIAAHIDAGKTTLTERILFCSGAIHRVGEVHDGTATTDFNPLEQQKGITIFAAAAPCEWTPSDEQSEGLFKTTAGERHRLNIIDTPGHVDFTVEVERSLRVLDGAIAVFSGVDGVQPQSETVWRQADRYGVPRIAFINKMDRVGADFERAAQDLRSKLGANAWPVLVPWGRESDLLGQIDVINMRALRFSGSLTEGYTVGEIPDDWKPIASRTRDDLVRQVAEVDDEIAEQWLGSRTVSPEALKQAIRRATIANRFVPVVGGSAYKNCGVQPLLDAVIDYLPSPADRPAISAHAAEDGAALEIVPDDESPVIGLAFKVAHDPQAGRLVFMRIYSGTLKKGDVMINTRTNRRERIGRLLRVFADRRDEAPEARGGDIIAATGLREFATGDTLCAPERACWLERPVFPEPVVTMALEPAVAGQRDRLATALGRLADEDPTFRTFTHPETRQTIIAGMGELHLDIVRERLATEHRVETTAGPPEMAYRETVRHAGESNYLLRKQNGGVGMYAKVSLRVSPGAPGAEPVVENRVRGGAIPAQYISSVERGVSDALREGAFGYAVVGVRIEILDGDAHEKDSNDLAFQQVARAATKEALAAAGPLLLEPIMRLEVTTPSECQGSLIGDLTRRRAQIKGVTATTGQAVIGAEAPLAELWGYAGATRNLSKGRASYNMSPIGFEPVPPALEAGVLRKLAA